MPPKKQKVESLLFGLANVTIFHVIHLSTGLFNAWGSPVLGTPAILKRAWFKGTKKGVGGAKDGEESFEPEIAKRLGVRNIKEFARRVASQDGEQDCPPSLEVTRERFLVKGASIEHIHPKECFLSAVFPTWHWGNLCLTSLTANVAKGCNPYIFSGVDEARWWLGWLLAESLLGAADLKVSDMLAFLLAVGVVHDEVYGTWGGPNMALSKDHMLRMVEHFCLSIMDPHDAQAGQQEQLPVYAEGHPYVDVFTAKVHFFCRLLLAELPKELAREFKEVYTTGSGQKRVDMVLRWSEWCFKAFLETLLHSEEGEYPHKQAMIVGIDDIPMS